MKRLKKADYAADAVTMAKMLLGKWLCRRLDGGTVLKARIVETEAYCGEGDTACHAHCGKTERNAPMYEAGGIAYVYLCYGMHNLLNVVTGVKGYSEAVLIRGVEGRIGPGRVTRFLQINRTLNREPLTTSKCLWIEDDGTKLPRFKATSRIGIAYATKRDQSRKWRFVRQEGEPLKFKSAKGDRKT